MKSLYSFLKVPVFTLTSMRAALDCITSFGLATFLPNIVMSYFAVSYSLASLLTGNSPLTLGVAVLNAVRSLQTVAAIFKSSSLIAKCHGFVKSAD